MGDAGRGHVAGAKDSRYCVLVFSDRLLSELVTWASHSTPAAPAVLPGRSLLPDVVGAALATSTALSAVSAFPFVVAKRARHERAR